MHKSIHNGSSIENFSLPRSSTVYEVKMPHYKQVLSTKDLIEHSFDNPISSDKLEILAKGKHNVVIISDDNTRPTPVSLILPSVLERLGRAGVKSSEITFLIASGTHRPMTEEEIVEKLGESIVKSYKVINHDYLDIDNLVNVGVTNSGTHITVNKIAKESDLVIGIGNIVPHRFCGFSGGAKIIVPGISGAKTTAATHLMVTKFPDIQMGIVENSAREEIEQIGEVFPSLFLINTVLDSHKNIVGVFCGDMKLCFREGVAFARSITSAEVPKKANIVIASPFPNDFNLWQAGKSLYTSDLAVKEGGVIILVSPLTEGIGEHDEFEEQLSKTYEQIIDRIDTGQTDDIIGASAALAVSLVRRRAELWIVSDGISKIQANNMNIKLFATVQDAVDYAIENHKEHKIITLIHDATEICISSIEP